MTDYTLTDGNDTILEFDEGDDLFSAATLADNRGFDILSGGIGNDTLVVDYSTTPLLNPSFFGTNFISSDGLGGFSGQISSGNVVTGDWGTTSFQQFEFLTIRFGESDDSISLDAASLALGATVNIGGGAGTDALNVDFTSVGETSFSVAADGTITTNSRSGTYSGFEIFNITLGGGTNTVQTQDGSDTVTGADSDYTVINSISTGAGDDQITTFNTLDTIDGGNGTDIWYGQRGASTDNLIFTANGTSANISDGSSATNIEIFRLTGGSGNDTFNVSGNASGTFDGSGGEDTLNLDFSGIANVSDYNSYIRSDTSGGFRGSANSSNQSFRGIEHVNLTLDDGDNTLNVDVTQLASGTTLNLNGGLGVDSLYIDARNAGAVSFSEAPDTTVTSNLGSYASFEAFNILLGAGTNNVATQGGNDVITTYDGGVNSISTGAGDDGIFSGANASDTIDTVDGGGGSDRWTVDRRSSLDPLTFTATGTSATISDGSSGSNIETFTFYGSEGGDTYNISGTTGGNFYGFGGEDTLNLDLSGITSPNGSSNYISSNGNGGFTGYTNGNSQTFDSIEYLNITLDDSDNFIFFKAGPLASGAVLSLSGGLGTDSLSVEFSYAGSTSFIVAPDGTITSNQGNFASFEVFSYIGLGAGTNTVETVGGADTVIANAGGINTINTGAGFDIISTYDTVDTIDGGDDYDSWSAYRTQSLAPVTFTVTGTSGTISDGSSATNIEYFSLTGSAGDDTFNTSGNAVGYFSGYGGEDTLNLDLSGTSSIYSGYSYIDSDGTGNFTGYSNGGSQYFYNMHHVKLTLDDRDNYTYVGAAVARGGATLSVDGGGGSDTVALTFGIFAGYSITAAGAGSYLVNDIDASDGDNGQFTIRNVEFLQFADQIYDLTVTNTGLTLIGDDNDNTLTGGDFDDTIDGRGGNDGLTGGGGIDTLTNETASTAVKVLLNQVGTAQRTGGAGNDTLLDKFENLTGSEYRDTLSGNDLANTIKGLGGNDLINGMEGADRLEGGAGNDSYVVDNADDVVIELDGEGTDSVTASVSHALNSYVENLVLSGITAGLVGRGNALGNRITANASGSSLSGGLGNDSLTGGASADTLTGEDDNDTLDGRGGADLMLGGTGNDVYAIDAFDTIFEDEDAGIDTVRADFTYTLGANFDRLTQTGTGNIDGTGNALDNSLTGNGGNNVLSGLDGTDKLSGLAGTDTLIGGIGNDTLDGGLGADAMTGGADNDTYAVDDSGDSVFEDLNQGTDTVKASISYTLGDDVEKLTLAGTGNIDGTGNALDNSLTGNGGNNVLSGLDGADKLSGLAGTDTLIGGIGNDTLDGGLGADAMTGGADNDTYAVDDSGDSVFEDLNQGTDTVRASISYTLGDHVEKLTLAGTGNVDGTGNALDNSLTGNGGNNVLSGLAGIDVLAGNAGNDRLIGGIGRDTLRGGAGADAFVFAVLETSVNRDSIGDFEHGVDKIELSASAFTAFNAGDPISLSFGTAATTSTDHLIYNKTTGVLGYDADGNGNASVLVQIAVLTSKPILDAGDFLLVA